MFPRLFFSSFVKKYGQPKGEKLLFIERLAPEIIFQRGLTCQRITKKMSMNGAIEKWDIFKERLLMNCYSLKKPSCGMAKIFKLKMLEYCFQNVHSLKSEQGDGEGFVKQNSEIILVHGYIKIVKGRILKGQFHCSRNRHGKL
jgi:hypothetical protein